MKVDLTTNLSVLAHALTSSSAADALADDLVTRATNLVNGPWKIGNSDTLELQHAQAMLAQAAFLEVRAMRLAQLGK